MLKSSFSKYLTAFVIIILVSFLMLSGIITSIIKTHALNEKRDGMQQVISVIGDYIEGQQAHAFDDDMLTEARWMINVALQLRTDIGVIITNIHGDVVLLQEAPDEAETESPADIGTRINVGLLKQPPQGGSPYLFHDGTLGGYFNEPHTVVAEKLYSADKPIGYVISYSFPEVDTGLVAVARKTVINSSIWVMLAAVIAAYFITERIIHPLKNMTVAAKKFAKGDFSTRVVVYGNDEVAELGNAFNNMAESLDSLEKMRNSFLANVSHDLRTPMTTISGFIDGITSGAIPPEKHDYYLGIISAEVHRLSRLVSQLLDVSRLESGERKFVFADFDIAEMARIILISFEQKIEDKRLDVSFEAEDDEMFALADKDAIHQVLYNVCHNAIKFAKDGGKFTIKLSRTAGKKILVSIFDEGQVLDKDEAKMIFDRFYKTDKSRGLDKSGVGLGLYIAKTIMDAHGEMIEALPIENEGCEFRFTLKEGNPVQKRKPQPRTEA